MLCAISGQPPEEPVVSTKSGHVFEKRLVEKYLAVNGKCPITGEPLTPTDLVPLKGYNKQVKPRVATTTNISSMLQMFQSEWDAVMLESFTLKQQLDTARQELAQTLYRHDAACRVIARLTKERDEARKMLSELRGQVPAGAATAAPEAAEGSPDAQEFPTLSDAIREKIVAKSQELSAGRRKRVISETLKKPEELKEYAVRGSHPVHKASTPGILCVDAHQTRRDGPSVATGGADGDVVLFDPDKGSVAATLSGHSRRVTAVKFHPTEAAVLSASADRTARVWTAKADGGYEAAQVLRGHEAEVVGLSVHVTGDYVATASLDRTWAMWDVRTGALVTRSRESASAPRAVAMHPDGLLLATAGADSVVRVWELKTQPAVVASFEGHKGAVSSLSFSENGFFLASGSEDGTAKIWDLRKLKVSQTFSPSADTSAAVSAVAFDWSGQYLGVAAATEIAVYHRTKTFDVVRTFAEHTKPVTGVSFGPDASFIASTSMDRNLKIFAAPSTDMES
eukprot:m51a1_g35 putative u-box domain-containing protein 72-like (510) ;mRNA; f:133993-136356